MEHFSGSLPLTSACNAALDSQKVQDEEGRGGRGRGGMLVFHMVTPWILKPAFSRFSYTNRVKQILQIKSGLLELRKTIVPSLRFTRTVFLYLSIYLSIFLSFFLEKKDIFKKHLTNSPKGNRGFCFPWKESLNVLSYLPNEK